MLHPDRNFATIACQDVPASHILAQLEFGHTCALLTADAARRAFSVFDEADTPDLEMRKTISRNESLKLEVAPLRQWTGAAKGREGALRAVLNCGAGPYLCRPLQMGADVVVEDLSDLTANAVAGSAVVAKTQRALEAFLDHARVDGGCSGGDEALMYVLEGSLPTLSLVTQRRCDRALVCAQFLAHHPRVSWVSYPGLADDPANDAGRRALEHGFGWRVAFCIAAESKGFAEGLWPDVLHGRYGSSVTKLGTDTYELSCGLEDALDIVGALEMGMRRREEHGAALS